MDTVMTKEGSRKLKNFHSNCGKSAKVFHLTYIVYKIRTFRQQGGQLQPHNPPLATLPPHSR